MSKTSVIIVSILGVVLAVGAAAVGVVVWTRNQTRSKTIAEKPDAKVPSMTRDQFREAVLWKDQGQIINAVGRPVKTSGGDYEVWEYKGVTFDPNSQKTDGTVRIYFRLDKIARDVRF